MVQGATEFLPVSSSGHLLLLTILVGGGGEPFFTVAMLHSATALAAVIYYRRACGQAARGLWRSGPARRFLWRYALAQAATAAVALPLFFILTRTPAAQWRLSLWAIGVAMLVNAVVLLLAPRGADGSGDGSAATSGAPAAGAVLPGPGWRAALWVGLAQGIAVLPGLSRAGPYRGGWTARRTGRRCGRPASLFCWRRRLSWRPPRSGRYKPGRSRKAGWWTGSRPAWRWQWARSPSSSRWAPYTGRRRGRAPGGCGGLRRGTRQWASERWPWPLFKAETASPAPVRMVAAVATIGAGHAVLPPPRLYCRLRDFTGCQTFLSQTAIGGNRVD